MFVFSAVVFCLSTAPCPKALKTLAKNPTIKVEEVVVTPSIVNIINNRKGFLQQITKAQIADKKSYSVAIFVTPHDNDDGFLLSHINLLEQA